MHDIVFLVVELQELEELELQELELQETFLDDAPICCLLYCKCSLK